MYLQTIVKLLIRIFSLAGLGFYLKHKGLIDDKIQQGLSKLLVSVFLPASILASSGMPLDRSMLKQLLSTGIITTIYFILSTVILFIILRYLPKNIKTDKQNIIMSLIIYANTAFMGYPLVESLLGQQAIIIAVIFNIFWNIFFFTAGISIMKDQRSIDLSSIVKNPATISSIIALIIYLSPFRLPEIATTILTDIGIMVTPISMILIGATLSTIPLLSLFRDRESLSVALVRLIIIPSLGIVLLRFFNIPSLAYQTLIVLLAMPSASMVAIHAALFKKEADFATRSVALNTALFVFSFPLILFLMHL